VKLSLMGLVLAALLFGARTARAQPGSGGMTKLALFGMALALVPSEVGAEVMAGVQDQVAPVIGWAYQLPLPIGAGEDLSHRLAFALEWTPGGAPRDVRVRLGHRSVVGDRLELGLGLVTGPGEVRVSPELGLRFSRDSTGLGGAHVRARLDVAPVEPRSLRAVVTLGWAVL